MDSENWFLWLAETGVTDILEIMAQLSPPAEYAGMYCKDERKFLYCTRQRGHIGPHAAHFGGVDAEPMYIGAVWVNNN